jgi:rifampicin phosphotransferase
MTATLLRRLRDVGPADSAEVGGKAASLGELSASGFAVPDGFVLSVDAAQMPAEARAPLLRESARDLGPGLFAVRSSGVSEDGAEQSFAGMYESVLNVSVDDVPAAADRCLASARTERVAEYGRVADGRIAVIVQRMVMPVAAGVALTADPINGDRRSTVITAVRGKGDRLVSGEAFGDEWVVRDGTPTARRQPEHAIDRRQAAQIAAEAARIAVDRGTPQDVEWAIDVDGKLWIVQARPMTALPPDVSWDSPAPGAFSRALRFGEWISEPVTPLFESWLLTAMEERLHSQLRTWIGQHAPRPHHVVVNGWYFYSLNWLSAGAMARSGPDILWHLIRSPRRVAGVIPPTVRHSIPTFEQEWREDLLPRHRAAVATAESRIETIPVAELPTLIDGLADLAGTYFASIAALAGAAYKMEINLALFYRRHLAGSLRDSHLEVLAGLEAPAEPGPHAVATLDWWETPATAAMPTRPAADHDRLAEARQAAETAAIDALARNPRRLRAFRRLLADTQHVVLVREEQVRDLTIGWPVARGSRRDRAVGRCLLPDPRRGDRCARGARRRSPAADHRRDRPPVETGRAGEACAAARRRPSESGASGVPGQPAANGRGRPVRPCPRLGRPGVAWSCHGPGPGHPRPPRVRPAATRRDSRRAPHRAGLDAALQPGGRGRDRRRKRGVARLDHRPRVRHSRGGRLRRCDREAQDRHARHGRRQRGNGRAGDVGSSSRSRRTSPAPRRRPPALRRG